MNMMFTIVPIFIVIIALLTFGGAIAIFFGFFRQRNTIHQITDEILQQSRNNSQERQSPTGLDTATDYSCHHCGASLGTDTEISPSGDFKCEYCDSWSSINR